MRAVNKGKSRCKSSGGLGVCVPDARHPPKCKARVPHQAVRTESEQQKGPPM